jgi:hypothetical protein
LALVGNQYTTSFNNNLAAGQYRDVITGMVVMPANLSVAGTVTTFANSVPETCTWTMLGLGFAGLAFAGFRRSKTSVSIA